MSDFKVLIPSFPLRLSYERIDPQTTVFTEVSGDNYFLGLRENLPFCRSFFCVTYAVLCENFQIDLTVKAHIAKITHFPHIFTPAKALEKEILC